MTSPELTAVEAPPDGLTGLLAEWARTDVARACAHSAGAYANCLAASVACARWLRGEGVECGLLHLTGILDPVARSAGRWPFCDPARAQHWTVRAGDWSIDWTARQFRRRAPWPLVEPVGGLSGRWRVVDDWACPRCPELFSDVRHYEL